jgi:circadian clock protein KaiC
MAGAEKSGADRVSTGVAGLDAIIGGGLPRNHVYLVQGDAGCGKTTLALQFLLAGVRADEPGLFVTLAETRAELTAVAASHGWSLDKVAVYEVRADEDELKASVEYTAFHPAEVELGEAIQTLVVEFERVRPRRVVIDSLSEMRLLARDPLRYRRQILALKQYFVSRDCTVVFLDDPASKVGEHQFQTLAHGVVVLERASPVYGRARRRLQVIKLRGVDFDDGYHDLALRRGGLVVFPRLVAAAVSVPPLAEPGRVSSGVPDLDAMLDGGPTRGTSLLLLGPAGAGKTTLCTRYAAAAADRGEHVAYFAFDERLDTLVARSAGVGMDLGPHLESGRVYADQIDPAEMSPGEFVHQVRRAVERDGAKLVVIDTLNGYLNAMPGDGFLTIQMHELLTYLGNHGVLTLVVVAQHGVVGSGLEAPVDLSYLADTVLLLRYFEYAGRVHKSVAVVKTRSGAHEDSIREYRVSADGVTLGPPLTEFDGVLSGTPTFTGRGSMLRGGGVTTASPSAAGRSGGNNPEGLK